MELTAIQIQSLIVCAVIIVTALIVWRFACKWEREEEEARRRRIRNRYRDF